MTKADYLLMLVATAGAIVLMTIFFQKFMQDNALLGPSSEGDNGN